MRSTDRNLQSIGKKIFVDYYYDFKNPNLDKNELADKLLEENPMAKSINGQFMRIEFARRIFADSKQSEALEIICSSARLDAETVKKARQILKDENRA